MMLLNLLYPPKCIHCKDLFPQHQLLCAECLDHFILLSKEGRCSKCFAEIHAVAGICVACRKISHPFVQLSSCFDAYGPASSIAHALLHKGQFHFAKDIASFIVIQLERLNYPSFDLVTCIPGYFHTPHHPVVKEVSRLLHCPLKNLLKKQLKPTPAFSLRKQCNIINKKLLLLDIRMETRQTIRTAAWALDQEGPETIHGMTFCAT